jgi:tagatose 6-phosphate kinase
MVLCLGATPTIQRTMIFERLTLDAVNRAQEVSQTASGKSLNVARVLHTLGTSPLATGLLGGEAGRFIRRDLERAGLAHEFVEVRPETRTCVTVIDRSQRQATELVEESQPVEATDYHRLEEVVRRRLPEVRAMVVSGTLTPQAPPGFYGRCAELAAAAGVRIIVDARGEPLRQALPCRPFLVKPNRAELGETIGRPMQSEADLQTGVTELIGRGAQWVVVTLGQDGALAGNGRDLWRIRVPRIDSVSPIGSGDAFAGGLAAALARGEDVPQACVLGAACGSANTLIPVAGRVRSQDVAELARRMTLEKL